MKGIFVSRLDISACVFHYQKILLSVTLQEHISYLVYLKITQVIFEKELK